VKPTLECLEDRLVPSTSTYNQGPAGYAAGQKLLGSLPNNTGVHYVVDVGMVFVAELVAYDYTSAALSYASANPGGRLLALQTTAAIDSLCFGFAYAALQDAYNGGHTAASSSSTAASPSASQSGPAASIAGTFSGRLTATNENDMNFGPRQINLTIKPDGTGSVQINPFGQFGQSSPLISFAGQITQNSDGSFNLGAKGSNYEIDLILARVVNGQLVVDPANGSFSLINLSTGEIVQYLGNDFHLAKQ
jgi:hypothetical protein